jgi:HK97 family phage major capsid protein
MSNLLTPLPNDYSLSRLIENLCNPTQPDCMEVRHSKTYLEARAGRPARQHGSFVPLQPIASGLDTLTSTGGGFLSQRTVSKDITEALRANSVLARAGARTVSGLNYGFSVPIQTAGSAATWVSENPGFDVFQSDPVFSSVVFMPRTLQATTAASRELVGLASPDLEKFLRDDFGRTLAAAVDAAGLDGSGVSNQPTGILRTAGITDIPLGSAGGTLSGINVAALEQAVADANGTPTAFIANPVLRAKLRESARFSSGTTDPIWTDSNTVLGYPGLVTTAMPKNVTKSTSTDCTSLLVGDFSNVVIALFSLEITLDPYTSKKRNLIEITLFATVDIGCLRPATFAVTRDARP